MSDIFNAPDRKNLLIKATDDEWNIFGRKRIN